MKIEICEQMIQSWLLNCKQCEIVQTNWSISPLRVIDTVDIDIVKLLMKEIQDELNEALDVETINALQESADNDSNEEYRLDDEIISKPKSTKTTKVKKLNIFKKSKPEQFIRQCEIDVVGTKFYDGVAERIYLVDSAFHKSGLGYHDAVATVIKKIIRAALVSAIIFGTGVPVSIIFAAPKCGDTLKNKIDDVVKKLIPIIEHDYPNITIELYFNETFSNEIYLPLKNQIKNLNNDNDLFMRALNLAAVAEGQITASVTSSSVTSAPAACVSAGPAKEKNETVVFNTLKNIIEKGKMSSDLLNALQTPAFAKSTFKMPSYPILLKEDNFSFFGFEKIRFYKKLITIDGDKYFVCSQWIPERIAKLKDWYNNL